MMRSSVVLPGAVRADQRGLGPFADPERDVVEQHPSVGQLETNRVELDVGHGVSVSQ